MNEEYYFRATTCERIDPLIESIEKYSGNIVKSRKYWVRPDGKWALFNEEEAKNLPSIRAYNLHDILSILDPKYIRDKINFGEFFWLEAYGKTEECEAMIYNILDDYMDKYKINVKK